MANCCFMKRTVISIFLLAFTGSISECCGQGTLLVGHFGSVNPTNEGFSLLLGGSPLLVSVTNDLGYNAWSIGVSSDADIAQYQQALTSQQADALSGGWMLSLTLRVSQTARPGDSGIFVGFGGVALEFGVQTNGNPAVILNYTEYDFSGGGSGYHNYQVRFDPATDLASLWIDGSEWLTGIQSSVDGRSLVWGESQHGSRASYYANWNEVALWAIPEPSTLSLIFFGSAVLAFACTRPPFRKWRRL